VSEDRRIQQDQKAAGVKRAQRGDASSRPEENGKGGEGKTVLFNRIGRRELWSEIPQGKTQE